MYRFLEVLPGSLAWLTLILMVVLSRFTPAFAAAFIILFDIYWLLKTLYLAFHLRSTFVAMRANLKVNWLRRLDELAMVGAPTVSSDASTRSRGASELTRLDELDEDWHQIRHLVIFPMFREPYVLVRESFERLTQVNYPPEKLLVVLATEARAGEEARETAERIQAEFGKHFGQFLTTIHPGDLPGEIPGKGSNASWAAHAAKELILDPLHIPYDRVLVSTFDIDTQVFPDYFARLAFVFLSVPNRLRAIYQPVPLFTNNIFEASAFSRVAAFSSTFWQMMQQSRPERLTSFSSQSIPFTALHEVGYWDRDVVSEDSRIFWQGYLRYHGDFRCEPLSYPLSMDANAAPSLWQTAKNVYKQHRRWGWGVENIPYLLAGLGRDPLIPRRNKWYWGFNIIEGFHSWATNALMIFAMGWLPVILGGDAFNKTLLSYSLPEVTQFIITLSMVGIATSAIASIVLLPPKPVWFRTRHYALYALQWLLVPVTLVVFGSVPALEAQTRLMLGGGYRLGFWITPKYRLQKAGVKKIKMEVRTDRTVAV